MTSRVIYQSVSKDSLFSVIADWCKSGAGRKNCSLQILSAFASGSGVNALTPLLDVFLADGNKLEIIFGVDRNGTDRSAVRHLRSLAAAYENQCNVGVFQAPSKQSIFHPKLYIFRAGSKVSFVIGSANLTSGGLSSNFESMIYYKDCDQTSQEAQNAFAIWKLFSSPKPPLKKSYLRSLTQTYLNALLKRLPAKHPQEKRPADAAVKDLWKPISRLPLPRSTHVTQRSKPRRAPEQGAFLLMDVLNETRYTQMQIPLDVVEDFFRVGRRQPADLSVSIWTDTGLSQPIHRTLVMSQGPKKDRLMRRLEMPQIRGLARPLAVLFMRLKGTRRFAFKLIPHYSKHYRIADRILGTEGQQGGAERRYVIGSLSEKQWKQLRSLIA